MKLFISQPMAGKTDKEILDERERVLCNVKELFPDKEIEVIDHSLMVNPKTASLVSRRIHQAFRSS